MKNLLNARINDSRNYKHLKTIKMLILQTNKKTNDGINKNTWTN